MSKFKAERFVKEKIKELKDTVGKDMAIVATSGGVDSTTCAALASHALAENPKVVFIDDGLRRENEPEDTKRTLKPLGINLIILTTRRAEFHGHARGYLHRKEEFFNGLRGLADPEEKRKAFRETFYRVLGQIVRDYKAKFLIQGTIAADILETKKE